jgi:asparagine N-glycosylation enzyme membrane subunit Stt3
MAYMTGILSFLLIILVFVGFVLMDITRSSTNGQNAIKYTTWSIIAFAFFFVMFKVYNGKHKALKKRLDSESAS